MDLLGPTRLDYHWQARAGAGFDAQHFQIDWDRQRATCPASKTSISWTPAIDSRENPVIKVKFSTKDCRRCDHVTQCIRSKKLYPRRTLTIRPQPQYQALQTARQREATEAFQTEYAHRAGIEGTISRETRSMRLRRTRYIGLRRVHLGHILAAGGLNVLRLGEWLLEMARAKTRMTPFARLMARCRRITPSDFASSITFGDAGSREQHCHEQGAGGELENPRVVNCREISTLSSSLSIDFSRGMFYLFL